MLTTKDLTDTGWVFTREDPQGQNKLDYRHPISKQCYCMSFYKEPSNIIRIHDCEYVNDTQVLFLGKLPNAEALKQVMSYTILKDLPQ